MSDGERMAARTLKVGLALVGLNVLGVFWFSASLSQMAASLRGLRESEGPPRMMMPTPPVLESAYSSGPMPPVDVSPAAGLKVPGIDSPSLCRPEQAHLPDQAIVIGVVNNGESRAYVIEAFAVTRVDDPGDLSVHIVNDMLGDEAITVTHCNLTHSTRVLAHVGAADSRDRLDVCVGGFEQGMLLVVDDSVYDHHARDLPLADVPFLTTSWRNWRERHPDTLVYTGQPCSL